MTLLPYGVQTRSVGVISDKSPTEPEATATAEAAPATSPAKRAKQMIPTNMSTIVKMRPRALEGEGEGERRRRREVGGEGVCGGSGEVRGGAIRTKVKALS